MIVLSFIYPYGSGQKALIEKNEHDTIVYNADMLRLRFEITKQSLKSNLICVVVFPMFKIASMSALANILRPICLTGQNRFIQTDRKQYVRFSFWLFIQG